MGHLNDLWTFDLVKNVWTWIGGSDQADQPGNYGTLGVTVGSNQPGARLEHAMTIDEEARLIYLFAGDGFIGFLNDLWTFSLISNQWTWISGSADINMQGDYVEPSLYPGSRCSISIIFDSQTKKLFTFGGYTEVSFQGAGMTAMTLVIYLTINGLIRTFK